MMLSDMKNLFEYSCPALNDMIIALSQKRSLDNLSFLKDCAIRLKNKEPFPSAWSCALINNRARLKIKSDDFNLLLSFGEDLGTTALEGQISICEMHKKLIDESLNYAQTNAQKYSKLLAPLGLLLGAAAAVMLI